MFVENEKDLESLVQTVWIFSNDISMEFDKDKLVLKRGKITEFNRKEGKGET